MNFYLFIFFFTRVGDAVVTLNKAGMWTDGRYFLQASMQMDNNWKLMKDGNMPFLPIKSEKCPHKYSYSFFIRSLG